MIYECTECDTIIPQGKSWVFGKDYLFCSTECRRIFLLRNPDIQNNITIPCRRPEQTQPYYASAPLQLPSKVSSPPCSPPESYLQTLLGYTLCKKTYISNSLRDIYHKINYEILKT